MAERRAGKAKKRADATALTGLERARKDMAMKLVQSNKVARERIQRYATAAYPSHKMTRGVRWELMG